MIRNSIKALAVSQQGLLSAVRGRLCPAETSTLARECSRHLSWSPFCQSEKGSDTSTSDKEPEGKAESSEEASTSPNGSGGESEMDVAALQAELEDKTARLAESQAQLAEMKDRALRIMADMENLRTRTTQQITDSKQLAIRSFAKSVLEISDNLQRALASVPAPMVDDNADTATLDQESVHKNLKFLYNGVALSEKVMLKVFKENGLERIEADIGGEFDPNLHNALFEVPTAEVEAGAIAAVTKTGYTLNGRVLRAADVGVARAAE